MARIIRHPPRRRMLLSFSRPHILSEPLSSFFIGRAGDDLQVLCSVFPKHWDIYILGGVLRNLLIKEICGIDLANADVDVVVSGPRSAGELQTTLRQFILRQNDFGGAKCLIQAEGLLFDVWRIDDHVSMSSSPGPYTIEQLLRHNLLDVDAILWDLKRDCLHAYGCLEAIQNGRIELIKEGIAPDFAPVQVAHILVTTLKTGFELSEEAQQFIREVSKSHHNKGRVLDVLQRKAPTAIAKLEALLDQFIKGGAHSWARLNM